MGGQQPSSYLTTGLFHIVFTRLQSNLKKIGLNLPGDYILHTYSFSPCVTLWKLKSFRCHFEAQRWIAVVVFSGHYMIIHRVGVRKVTRALFELHHA